MSEKDFELYLSLLSRFLRLSPAQRDEIADELRDHFQERLEELTSEGVSREDAIRRALDEFGDAAGLANHFTRIAHERKRRLIMRCTFGSIAALAAAMLIATAFWPETPNVQVNRQAVAQQETVPQDSNRDASEDISDLLAKGNEGTKSALVDKKLSTETEVAFNGTPLPEVLSHIGELVQVDILVNERSLDDEGMDPDYIQVFLVLNHTTVSARTALQLILEPHGLTFRIRDGFVYVETMLVAAEALELRVYDCRDLLAGVDRAGEPAATSFRSSTREYVTGQDDLDTPLQRLAGRRRGETSGRGRWERLRMDYRPTLDNLLDMIWKSTSGPWQQVDGEGGTIVGFDGLLVVRQTQAVHREVEDLLKRIRATKANLISEHDVEQQSEEDESSPAIQ